MPIISGAGSGSGALTLICNSVLTGAQASFDTNTILGGNIPAAYKHLKMVFSGRDDAAGNLQFVALRLNNDSGANYYSQALDGAAAVAAASESLGQTSGLCGVLPGATATASFAGGTEVILYDYLGTTFHKQWTALSVGPYNTTSGTTDLRVLGGRWASASAITRITIFVTGSNFIAGSRFTLYGIS